MKHHSLKQEENPKGHEGSHDLKTNTTERPLDPNVLQRKASDTYSSVWVSASAGTGKTKVLTDRILRLLLPRIDKKGQIINGVSPEKILCLTFTKAGASEMALRINKKLSEWVSMNNEDLEEELQNLLGEKPHEQQKIAARKSFSNVVDNSMGLPIMTIHAFCQSLLGRFPLEADVPAYFSLIDEHEAENLLNKAAKITFSNSRILEEDDPLKTAFDRLVTIMSQKELIQILLNMTGERYQLDEVLEKNFGVDGVYTNLQKTLAFQHNETPEKLRRDYCRKDPPVKHVAQYMAENGTKTEGKYASIILDWFAKPLDQRVKDFNEYCSAFITSTNEARTSSFPGAKTLKNFPESQKILRTEADTILTLKDRTNKIESAYFTRDLLTVGHKILNEYNALKNKQAVLDYNDLIFKTLTLLRTTGNPDWVMYKLDNGLEHILVDEAQDTNPEQWAIIEALCTSFFENTEDLNPQNPRTVFVVGDEKQSIFSFQRAAPEEFNRMKQTLQNKAEQARLKWSTVSLNISFRSVPSVFKSRRSCL